MEMGLTLDQKGRWDLYRKLVRPWTFPPACGTRKDRTGQDRVGKGLAGSDRGPGHRQRLVSANPPGPLGSRQHRGQPLPELQQHPSGFSTSPPTPVSFTGSSSSSVLPTPASAHCPLYLSLRGSSAQPQVYTLQTLIGGVQTQPQLETREALNSCLSPPTTFTAPHPIAKSS